MDEPTSGLDARAAGIVMRTVRNAVDIGRTVVCTIHQPSIEIFHDFDELLLLKCGGEAIYVGPLGHGSCHLIKFFEAIEGVPKIKDGCNPAAWMLDVTTPANELALGVDFAQIYGGSDQFRRTKALIEELNRSPQDSQQLRFPSQFSQIFFMQFLACLWKQHQLYWHNSLYTLRRLCVAAVMAFLLGTMFWDLGSKVKTKEDLFNAMGSMFVAVMFLGVQNSTAVQPLIVVERTVLYRERAAAMYSAIPYALAQVAIEIPYGAMQALLYVVIIYAMIGFEWSVGKFFWYLFFTFFSFLYFTVFGMMMIAMSPDQSVALTNLFQADTLILIPRLMKDDSNMMEMVLLGLPCSMEHERPVFVPIRRHQGCPRRWIDSPAVPQRVQWLQARLLGSGLRQCYWLCSPLCDLVRFLCQDVQLPEALTRSARRTWAEHDMLIGS
ncbi:hypothetical protein Drorol1_Dr00007560 [Drosera rotundifolia]